MEKGILDKETQKAFLKQVQEWIKDQKAWLRLIIVLGVKGLFVVLDDKYADKLPNPLKEQARDFFNAVLIQKDMDKAILLGVALLPEIIKLFGKKDPIIDSPSA